MNPKIPMQLPSENSAEVAPPQPNAPQPAVTENAEVVQGKQIKPRPKWLKPLLSPEAKLRGQQERARATGHRNATHAIFQGKRYSDLPKPLRYMWARWTAMRQRCTDIKCKFYHRYGGRGIKVCERWMTSFTAFLEDMGYPPTLKHSIERINNDGNYEPSNCKWATRTEQARNKTSTRFIIIGGIKKNLSQWSEESGLDQSLITARIRLGWPEDKWLSPPHTYRHNG